MYLGPRGFDGAQFPRLSSSPATLECYVRAHDAGETTYIAWQWHDDPVGRTVADHVHVLADTDWEASRRALISALVEGDATDLQAVLSTGAFASVERERALAKQLASEVMPVEFWEQLDRAAKGQVHVRLLVTPSQRLAPVPWELLVSPVSEERVLRLAETIYEVPYTVHWSRGRLPQPWGRPDEPLHTVDVDAEGSLDASLPVIDPTGREILAEALGTDPEARPRMSRADLGAALRALPTRWLYVGHVSSGSEVGLAAIHLTDHIFGDDGELPWFGFAKPNGNHRPLTARDLHLGTNAPQAHASAHTHRLPAAVGTDGADIWPMPGRVAFVACASGADHASPEIFGLATAALASGAEWVTATRWALPTDHAFHTLAAVDPGEHPLVELVLAVDETQRATDPAAELRAWQLGKLDDWERDSRLEDSPLLWGSLMTYWMPARPELRNPQLKPISDL